MAALFYHVFMEIFNLADNKQILEILNRPRPSDKAFRRMLSDYKKKGRAVSQNERKYYYDLRVSKTLRRHIDEWLRTGRNLHGKESPSDRDMFRTVWAKTEAILYLEKHRIYVMFNRDTSSLHLTFPSERPMPSQNWEWDDINAAAKEEANRLFVSVMASDWKRSLCKCRYSNCEQYFSHTKPREYYEHGMYCSPKHLRLQSAKECTRRSRSDARTKLVKLAAKILVAKHRHCPDWQADDRLKGLIAADLSAEVSMDPNLSTNRQEIKINWVTRHSREIEEKRIELEKSQASER